MRITVILNECEGSRAFIFKFKYILEVPFSGDLGHILGGLKHKRAKKCNKCINPIQLRFSNFTSFPDEAYFSKDEEI